MRQTVLVMTLISITIFGTIPLYSGNPAGILKDSWLIAGLDLDSGGRFYSNLFNLEDLVNGLLMGSTITIDKERIEMVENGLSMGLDTAAGLYLCAGLNPWRIGFEAYEDGGYILSIPGDVARLLLGGSDYEENVNEEFNLIKGSVSLKTGFVFGSSAKGFDMAVAVGVYFPLLAFDPKSKVEFVYESDPDEGKFHSLISGGTTFYTSLDPFSKRLDMSSAGLYIDTGIIYSYQGMEIGLAFSNLSPVQAKVKYQGTVSVNFEASITSGDFSVAGPDYTPPTSVSTLTQATDVSLPTEITGFLAYNFGIADLGVHFSYVPSLPHSEVGFYASLQRTLWIDFKYLSEGYWEKNVGLNLHLVVLKLSAYLGVIDNDPFNVDLSEMKGLKIALKIGAGF